MASIEVDEEPIQLDPVPGFVVKTKIVNSRNLTGHPIHMKVFMNICHDKQVPKPSKDFDPPEVFPLIINNEWEIPIIVSNEKENKDKKGQPSLVYDCCINSLCFQWCQVNSDLRSILIEWCIEAIELLYELTLEREYSIPKMLSKGDLSHTIIRRDELNESGFLKKLQELKENETSALISELDKNNEDADTLELPPLMSINNKKPLIEEIESDYTNFKSTTSKPLPKEVQSQSSNKLDYSTIFQRLSGMHHLLIKFQSSQLNAGSIELSYDANAHNIIIRCKDKDLIFKETSSNSLDIPLPTNINVNSQLLKCFYVEPEKTFYIYI